MIQKVDMIQKTFTCRENALVISKLIFTVNLQAQVNKSMNCFKCL